VVERKVNCDIRRRRRRRIHRRRGKNQTCDKVCDIRLYAKASVSVGPGKVWIMAEYFVRNKDFDLTLGADVHINLLFTSYWKNVAKVKMM